MRLIRFGLIAAVSGALALSVAAQTQPQTPTPAQTPAPTPAPAQTAMPFDVTVPAGFGAFTAQSRSDKTAAGNIETTNWVAKAPTGEAVVVTVSKMPAKVLDPQKLVDGTRDSLLKSLGATLESEEKIAGTPATRLMFHNASVFLRARLQVRDDTLYQLLYIGRSNDQRSAPAVGQLFDSFRLAPPANAVAVTAPVPATKP